MRHTPILAASFLMLISGGAWAQSSSNMSSSNAPPAPPPQASAQNNATDMDCRRQAASQTGYNSSTAANSDAEHRYADAYYACMDNAYGPPSPGYAPGYAYGPPPPSPYYYGGYPYPYYYPPYYYGPGVSFGLRFGGRGHWR